MRALLAEIAVPGNTKRQSADRVQSPYDQAQNPVSLQFHCNENQLNLTSD